MSITIYGALASPHNLSNGTTSVKITFKGRSRKSGVNVKVTFTIKPFPALSFTGLATVEESFVFDVGIKTFSKTVDIANKNAPTSSSWLPGEIILSAKEVNSGSHDQTYTGLQYK